MKRNAILITMVVLSLALPAAAATITVTTTDPAVASDGQCSLIEAILNANADAAVHADCPAGNGADTIELASSADYVLDEANVTFSGPNGLPIISSEITIEGHGSTIRRAPGSPPFRFLPVNTSGVLGLEDLTLENGAVDTFVGGALLNLGGQVTLTRTTVTGSSGSVGGGL